MFMSSHGSSHCIVLIDCGNVYTCFHVLLKRGRGSHQQATVPYLDRLLTLTTLSLSWRAIVDPKIVPPHRHGHGQTQGTTYSFLFRCINKHFRSFVSLSSQGRDLSFFVFVRKCILDCVISRHALTLTWMLCFGRIDLVFVDCKESVSGRW